MERPCKIICKVFSVPKDPIPFKTVAPLGAKADEVSWVKPTSCCTTYQTEKSEGLVQALKPPAKEARDAVILFTTQGT